MARLILDTTILVEFERAGRGLDDIANETADVAIAAITAAELLVGVELADSSHQPARRSLVESILRRVPIENYDVKVARAHATLIAHGRRTGRPRQSHDLIVAATAVARNRTVVTLDLTGFEGLPGVNISA